MPGPSCTFCLCCPCYQSICGKYHYSEVDIILWQGKSWVRFAVIQSILMMLITGLAMRLLTTVQDATAKKLNITELAFIRCLNGSNGWKFEANPKIMTG